MLVENKTFELFHSLFHKMNVLLKLFLNIKYVTKFEHVEGMEFYFRSFLFWMKNEKTKRSNFQRKKVEQFQVNWAMETINHRNHSVWDSETFSASLFTSPHYQGNPKHPIMRKRVKKYIWEHVLRAHMLDSTYFVKRPRGHIKYLKYYPIEVSLNYRLLW